MQNEDEETRKALAQISCKYCGSAISPHQAIQPGHCGAEPCFLAHISHGVQAQNRQKNNDYSERQAAAIASKSTQLNKAAAYLNCDKDDLLVAAVPFQNNPIEAPSSNYREAFQMHLKAIVSEAFSLGLNTSETADGNPDSSTEPPIIEAACSACQGYCCAKGGGEKYAFLTVTTVLNYLRQYQDSTAEEVISFYDDAIPDASVREACIYQSELGCTLERSARASICNSFYCHDIYALHELTEGRMDVSLAIVAINDDVPRKVTAFSHTLGHISIDPT